MSAHRRLGVPGAGVPGCKFQDERIGAEAMTAEAIRVDVELELLDHNSPTCRRRDNALFDGRGSI
jgi:hypothetical protein